MPIILKENECVHCKTQKEFDRVNEILSKQFDRKQPDCNWGYAKKQTCISNHPLYGYGFSNTWYYKDHDFKIYSFEEFMGLEKIYTQKEVDAIIADTKKKTIKEMIERLKILHNGGFTTINNLSSNSRCSDCGRFTNKIMGCKHCNK